VSRNKEITSLRTLDIVWENIQYKRTCIRFENVFVNFTGLLHLDALIVNIYIILDILAV